VSLNPNSSWQIDTGRLPDATGVSDPDCVRKSHSSGLTLTLRLLSDGWHGARINTRGLIEFSQGAISFKAKLPKAYGVWAALWTMGDPWPQAYEFDLVETGMPDGNLATCTMHGPDASPKVGTHPHDGDWHTYRLTRQGKVVRWFIDDVFIGQQYAPVTRHWLCADLMARAETPPVSGTFFEAEIGAVTIRPLR